MAKNSVSRHAGRENVFDFPVDGERCHSSDDQLPILHECRTSRVLEVSQSSATRIHQGPDLILCGEILYCTFSAEYFISKLKFQTVCARTDISLRMCTVSTKSKFPYVQEVSSHRKVGTWGLGNSGAWGGV